MAETFVHSILDYWNFRYNHAQTEIQVYKIRIILLYFVEVIKKYMDSVFFFFLFIYLFFWSLCIFNCCCSDGSS